MPTCETCGNDYDKAFQVTMNVQAHTFDSFECAIHALVPTCKHCGTRIVWHGFEQKGVFYCCDHCASKDGVSGLRGEGRVISRDSAIAVRSTQSYLLLQVERVCRGRAFLVVVEVSIDIEAASPPF